MIKSVLKGIHNFSGCKMWSKGIEKREIKHPSKIDGYNTTFEYLQILLLSTFKEDINAWTVVTVAMKKQVFSQKAKITKVYLGIHRKRKIFRARLKN